MEDTKNNKLNIKLIFSFLFVLLALGGVIFYFYKNKLEIANLKNVSIIMSGNFYNNPTPVQNAFLESVISGNKDENVKLYAYWLSHRYADNGGDVQEIYDYVNSRPELDFLKSAEDIEPKNFALLRDGKIENNTPKALTINDAYMEILYENGYGDLAMIANLAHDYGELASIDKDFLEEEKYKKHIASSKKYFDLATPMVVDILNSNLQKSNTVTPQDTVVGLNHYIMTVAIYKILGIYQEGNLKVNDIYQYAMSLAKDKVRTHWAMTGYAYVASLAMSGGLESTQHTDIDTPLAPLVSVPNVNAPLPIFILKSTGDDPYNIFGRKNITILGQNSVLFKNWLITNSDGNWKESDFAEKATSTTSILKVSDTTSTN